MKDLSRFAIVSIVVLVALGFGATFSLAQGIVTGSISGVVLDPQGAVVAGAKVSATHIATNRGFKTETNSAGLLRSGICPRVPTASALRPRTFVPMWPMLFRWMWARIRR